MGLSVLIAAARKGKTEWAVNQALKITSGLERTPFVLLPSQSQVDDFKMRIANRGGAIGVLIGTFSDLCQGILDRSGKNLIVFSEIAQIRLLRSIIDDLDLSYYQRIKNKPGFSQSVLSIIRELEAGMIAPEDFLESVKDIDRGERLRELALIYQEYRQQLANNQWADQAALTWNAVDTLKGSPGICPEWDSLIVDGFDDLSPAQLELVFLLSDLIPSVTVTITGSGKGIARPLVHKRFNRLKAELTARHHTVLPELEVEDKKFGRDVFDELEERLFTADIVEPLTVGDEIKMMAVPDREYEVRSAFRWVKTLIVNQRIDPEQAALIARNLEPYRKIIEKVAHEYRLPVLIKGGLALDENPAIASIINLLRLASTGKRGLAWRDLISVWSSPYWDWSILYSGNDQGHFIQSHLIETRQLVEIARWGSVIQGFAQWEEAFGRLVKLPGVNERQSSSSIPEKIPTGNEAENLWKKFNMFLEIITPPDDGDFVENYIRYIENLLGDMNLDDDRIQGLNIYRRIMDGELDLIERDLQAIRKLKAIFREQIWADLMFGNEPTTFGAVLENLEAQVHQQSYQPAQHEGNRIVCADCAEIRGIGYQAVALIGLAEGEFPGTIKEDPFLRNDDRLFLREAYGLALRSSTESAEAEFFYEAVCRSSGRLLMTRPRIADNGTTWQPSPYWEEMLRRVNVKPEMKTSRNVPALEEAGSISELFEVIGALEGNEKLNLADEINKELPQLLQRINLAERIIYARAGGSQREDLVYDGGLEHIRQDFKDRYPPDYVWSASRLENYQVCPLNFFVNNLLGFDKQEPPQEGLDARQLGNIYHHIMEDLYLAVEEDYGIQELLVQLPLIAERVFQAAPKSEGFRETSWWHHTQNEIIANIQRSLIALEGIDASYRFYKAEQKFGIRNHSAPQLHVEVKGLGSFQLRGLIDRVDINDQKKLRIIDYKTSSPFGFDNQSVREGKKLQLPLYALAAQKGLQLGDVEEGFYFHVRSAQTSSFKMSSFWNDRKRGPQAAMDTAMVKGWQAVDSIQKGRFSPMTPANGCPEYCPAVDFCWKYQRQIW